MIKARLMNSKEVKQLKNKMFEQFGTVINGVFFINNKNKVFLTTIEASNINLKKVNAEGIGVYIGRINDDGFRPTIEGVQLLRPTKNVVQLSSDELWEWLRGFNIKKNGPNGYCALKYNNEFVGPGKIINGVLWNYIPRERRFKNLVKKD